jgi:epsilon-lactone hydrolase
MMARAFRWLSAATAAATMSILAFGLEPSPRLAVPAREVPVPPNASPELQKMLAGTVKKPVPMPTTTEGWKKLQVEVDASREKGAIALAEKLGAKVEPTEVAGVKCFRITPKTVAPENENRLLVHVHGGAFVFASGRAATTEGVYLADACKMRALSIDYRMPPDHPYPAAPDDVVAVWKALLKEHDPKSCAMGGSSAGGALVMTALLRCKAEKLPMPAATFVGTPASDLSKTGDSYFLNAEVDRSLGRYEGRLEECFKLYAAGHDLKEPLLSPVYGDLAGLPPTILMSGTRDLLLSCTLRSHRKFREGGVPAELHVFEGQCHADYLSATPESREALAEIAAFFERHLRRTR